MNSQPSASGRLFRGFFSQLRVRLMLLVLLALVPVLGLVVYTSIEERASAMAETKASALRMVRLAATGQKQHIEAARQLLITLAQLSEVRQTNGPACEALFATLLTVHRIYANFGLIGPDGYLIASGIPGRRAYLGDRSYFVRARDTLKFAVGDYQKGRVSGKGTVNLGYPVRDPSGRFIGVIYAALDLEWLNQLIARADMPDHSTLTAIDRIGTVVLRYPDKDNWTGKSARDVPGVARILASNKEDTTRKIGFDKTERVYAYTPLSRTEGIADAWVLVGIPAQAALGPAYRTLVANLIYLSFVMALALAAAWFGGDVFILQKVRSLVSATRRVATGDLKARTGATYDQGELGELAHAFDEMAQSLEQRVAERQRAEADLKALNEHLEQRVLHRTKELKRSNEDLEQFAYVASHDLQEPLRMVTSYMQLLRQRYKGQLDQNAQEFIAFALDGAERMQCLIVDLLSYSRVGTKAKPPVPTDMSEVLTRALRNLTIAIEESGAKISHGPLPVISGDTVQLTQLFQNLIANAIKFRSERPLQIYIDAKPENNGWAFSVSDNGIGIPRKDFERIFVIFQRLHTREKYPGTGIGLSICKRIVERHGGRIWLDSEEGKGTTFHFFLPSELPTPAE